MDFEIVFPHMIQGKGTHFLCFVFFENENGNHSWDTSVPSARSSFERPTSVPVFFFFFFFCWRIGDGVPPRARFRDEDSALNVDVRRS